MPTSIIELWGSKMKISGRLSSHCSVMTIEVVGNVKRATLTRRFLRDGWVAGVLRAQLDF